MKKSSLLIIALFGIISCSQDDDSFQNSSFVPKGSNEILYQKEGEAKDSLVVPSPQNGEDGDPPPKIKDQNGGKLSPKGSINTNIK